jgi:hypothetical protein
VGELEPALVDVDAGAAVMVVLGEVLDAALAGNADVVVCGSVQPEGYHFVIDAAAGERAAELTQLADAMRGRDPIQLPFGLRAAAQAGRRARLLMWLTLEGVDAQWHVLVPPDSFRGAAGSPAPIEVPAAQPEPEPENEPEPELIEVPAEIKPVHEPVAVPTPDGPDSATAHRLGDALTNLFERLEAALAQHTPDGLGLDENERTALLIDGTRLVGKLQQAQLCSSKALRALLRAIDAAVGAERSTPLAGSARDRVALPYEVLTEIREHVATADQERVDSAGPST